MVPGIDFAGTVDESSNPSYQRGDRVVLNGWGVGESHWGGLAQRARVKGGLADSAAGPHSRHDRPWPSAPRATRPCCVSWLWNGMALCPASGEILVTGAAGGVGSVAVALLSKLGFRVVAVTGRAAEADFLSISARRRSWTVRLFASPGQAAGQRALGRVRSMWSAATRLANVCASLRYGGVVAACGLAAGMDFPATVAPFILRGITLAGVDSVMRPRAGPRWKPGAG